MFTGIIKNIGQVTTVKQRNNNRVFTITLLKKPSAIELNLKPGDSIAVDGVCLTVLEATKEKFSVEAVSETLRNTTLSLLKVGSYCNLEPALTATEKISGHLVLGHIDEVGKILEIAHRPGYLFIEIEISERNRGYLVKKGSVAVLGISLTVQEVFRNSFSVNIIPYTYENTTLKYKRRGDKVNIEYDILAKYVMRMLNLKSED